MAGAVAVTCSPSARTVSVVLVCVSGFAVTCDSFDAFCEVVGCDVVGCDVVSGLATVAMWVLLLVAVVSVRLIFPPDSSDQV